MDCTSLIIPVSRLYDKFCEVEAADDRSLSTFNVGEDG
jgi:hypothetical protein